MRTYIAFLRAINLGARRVFPQDAIRASAEAAGFREVKTHINTGNVRLTHSARSVAKVQQALESAYAADRAFAVPAIVFTPAEVREIVADADELAGEMESLGMHYVSLLERPPTAEVVALAQEGSTETERLVVRGRAAHLLMAERDSYHTATLSNSWVERRLGVATNRNMRVVRAVAEKWC